VIKSNHVVDVPSVGDREPRRVTQKVLVDIIEARMVEILEMVNRELVVSGQKNRINAGIVLTGGTSLLVNLVDLAEQIFDMPVRVGYPSGIGGRVDDVYTPRCTTGVGLVLYGRDHQMSATDQDTGVMDKMRGLFKKIM
jgi:cell division protein FtsA